MHLHTNKCHDNNYHIFLKLGTGYFWRQFAHINITWRRLCTFNMKSWKWIRFFLQLDGLPRQNNISYLKWRMHASTNILSKYYCTAMRCVWNSVISTYLEQNYLSECIKWQERYASISFFPSSFSINKRYDRISVGHRHYRFQLKIGELQRHHAKFWLFAYLSSKPFILGVHTFA
jgi:hypothetical protein